ncbi:MAG TPA: tripartite tricarboxylate transporter substrate binding protein [Xanthobacteraceae bacterium]|jgi:tripartite-type tricarboxylate transporter receptor subunit TctC|nr:tripartite tricarboxylate transporter substrate binding protein [Xanthobacteraceae bacterium]
MNRRVASRLLFAALLGPFAAFAQDYPTRPIRLIVPFPAGGPSDLFGRLLAIKLTESLGQQVVIENRSGVGGVTGVDVVARSTPDGYTIGLASAGALAIMPFMMSKMPFDWKKDLALLTLLVRVPEVLVVNPSLKLTTLKDLVDYARANPGKLNFGTSGTGSMSHLAVEQLKAQAHIDLVHVPYRGAAPAVTDLLAGQVQLVALDAPVLIPHVHSGALTALAVTSQRRAASLPQVPTTAEAGFPSVLSDNWYGLIAPAKTPPDIQHKIAIAATAALSSDDLKAQYAKQDAVAAPATPAEFAAFVTAEQAKWKEVVAATGVKFD